MANLNYFDDDGVKHQLPVRGAVSSVNGRTGVVTGLAEETDVENKLDKNQGAANAGKLLGVGENGNILLTDKELFIAEYGVTTYSEVSAAIDAGKFVFATYTNRRYYLADKDGSNYIFAGGYGTYGRNITLKPNDSWDNANPNLENASRKVTTLSSESTDTQYPSAKCVYDLIGDVESLLAAL